MHSWNEKVIVITGGTSGIGKALALASQHTGAQTIVIARSSEGLQALETQTCGKITAIQGDVTDDTSVKDAISTVINKFGKIDVWINNVGKSCRGEARTTSVEEFRDFIDFNFLTSVRCTNAVLEYLIESKGSLVNIGSLASKTGGFYMGPYPASKFPLAAYSHQLRLELESEDVHVLLVCPGPVARKDSGNRYDVDNSLPESATLPAGGVKITRLCPDQLAKKILRAVKKKKKELILPESARWLFAISQLSPRLGDWIIKLKSNRS
ncbi:MAG: hypothetical protein CMJ76_03010 [Planctomycetaceae bacterium]|nr:hypothetical protein [Planctomycetaceae bacterium]